MNEEVQAAMMKVVSKAIQNGERMTPEERFDTLAKNPAIAKAFINDAPEDQFISKEVALECILSGCTGPLNIRKRPEFALQWLQNILKAYQEDPIKGCAELERVLFLLFMAMIKMTKDLLTDMPPVQPASVNIQITDPHSKEGE